MRIGLSTASFYPELTTEQAVLESKRLGFDCGEIFLNSVSEYKDQFIEKLKNNIDNLSMDILSVHAFSSSFEPYLWDRYKRRRNDMFDYFKMVCKAAKYLGAKYYTFHGLKSFPNSTLDMDFIVEIYNELCYTACESGITLAQENVSWCSSHDIEFLKMLKEKVKYPLTFTLDIKQAYRAGIEPSMYIEEVMQEDLVNIHINDRDEINSCMLPGHGTVNYLSVFEMLDKFNYKGDLIIEVYRENFMSSKELINSKVYLEKLINKL
ncbi:sugar phosphate isomerase/epimerase [Clostridium sp. 19966]|uniref:sugar phosphate isomerase/epimerase family protein n=1 Tax=Clostridium sp. 19966 TaxID=2768166 RepID=UPI0028E093EE|nr:sugar phosphate isomerase/epimerase [Clostridium sp. 19966]MDT8719376.1 sugar phosphate isomerase/epimerase [Clostridium sp. 19966]